VVLKQQSELDEKYGYLMDEKVEPNSQLSADLQNRPNSDQTHQTMRQTRLKNQILADYDSASALNSALQKEVDSKPQMR